MAKKKIAFIVAIPGSAESFLVNHFEQLVNEYDVIAIENLNTKGILVLIRILYFFCN